LCRPGTVEKVKRKAEELGLLRSKQGSLRLQPFTALDQVQEPGGARGHTGEGLGENRGSCFFRRVACEVGLSIRGRVMGLLLCQFAPFWKEKRRCLALRISRASPPRLTTLLSSWGWWIARIRSCWWSPGRQSSSRKRANATRSR